MAQNYKPVLAFTLTAYYIISSKLDNIWFSYSISTLMEGLEFFRNKRIIKSLSRPLSASNFNKIDMKYWICDANFGFLLIGIGFFA